jgi:hypothetical protein
MISLGYKRTGAGPERKDKDLELRAISTSVHVTLDYLASGVHLAFPALLELDDAPAAALITYLNDSARFAMIWQAIELPISTAPSILQHPSMREVRWRAQLRREGETASRSC